MNNLQAIRVFARVVETGSFTRAAVSLQMPLATVSKLIQDLESELGVKLLQRNTRNVATTSDGADYYDRVVPIMIALYEINSSFGAGHHPPSGKIRINSGASFAGSVLIPALPDFQKLHPGIEIDLRIDDRPTDMVREGIDCAIRGGPMHDTSLVARKIGDVSWITCASPAYLERFGVPMHPHDLKQSHQMVKFISARTGLEVPVILGIGEVQVKLEAASFLSVNEGNAQLTAALAGIGIIHSLAFKVRPYIATGQLVPILEAWPALPYPYHIVYPFNRHLNQRLRIFIDWLADRMIDVH